MAEKASCNQGCGSGPFSVEAEARKIYRFRFHIALVDTEANHTSSYLKEILLDTLKQFNISKQQGLACVVDNASNMTRTVQLLNEDEDDDEEIKEIQDSLSINHIIYHMRCAEHTLQLEIRDVLKKRASGKVFNKIAKTPHAATIYFQKQYLTPGECLLHWREVKFKLQKLDNNLASALATAMQSRQEFLSQKEAFLAAVWVSSVC